MDRNYQTPSIPIERVTDWQPGAVQRALAASSRNFVGLMHDGCTVLKYPQRRTADNLEALYEEAARFKHIGIHDNIVAFKGLHQDGIMFEYCAQGHLEGVIRNQSPLPNETKRALGEQIARGLLHLHEHNFIHCDLNIHNVFVTSAMDAKIGDIQGQLYRSDGTVEMPTMSEENVKSRHPHVGEDEFSQRTDIFALGTLLYHLWHGHSPFPNLDEHQDEEAIQAKYRRGEFPVDASAPSKEDRIVWKCWNSSYTQASEVLRDLENLGIEERLESKD